ncbi:MAG: hypothetical protein M5U26_16515 [Planctomycetota bacterium]|nr:hypothetical protein [Planctomycetota bacterium]
MRWTRFAAGLGSSALLALSMGCATGEKDTASPRPVEPGGAPPSGKGSGSVVTAPPSKLVVDNSGVTLQPPKDPTLADGGRAIDPLPIPPFVEKSLGWLAKAQHPDGGWGAGSHARQDVRDPHQVQVDPATTAFTACAFLRAGHTPDQGAYKDHVRRAANYLVKVVEQAPESGPRITELMGTQIQSKLGDSIDTSMAMQFFIRVLPRLEKGDPLRDGVNRAIDKCLAKLQKSQAADGSWGGGTGWAPVLLSSLNCSSLEFAQAEGRDIDEKALKKAREFQKGNVNAQTGAADASKGGAGVELYAFAGGQRASAGEARAAKELIEEAKAQGKLHENAEVDEKNIAMALGGEKPATASELASAKRLADAYVRTEATLKRLEDEQLLAGFGNNGGEEFLSYMLTSESLVIAGGERWDKWNAKMHERLEKIQNPDGTWSGHHCITSPVFCTAAAVQCLTTDRDAKQLLSVAQQAREQKPKAE